MRSIIQRTCERLNVVHIMSPRGKNEPHALPAHGAMTGGSPIQTARRSWTDSVAGIWPAIARRSHVRSTGEAFSGRLNQRRTSTVEPLPFHVMKRAFRKPSPSHSGSSPRESQWMRSFSANPSNAGPVRRMPCARGETDRTVRRCGELVPEGRLQEAGGEQLPHALKTLDRFLDCLTRTSIHEIGMDQDAGFFESEATQRGLIDGDALLHFVQ